MTKITAELTKPLLIDGAMSTALEQLGADTNNSLWTASVLANQPASPAPASLHPFAPSSVRPPPIQTKKDTTSQKNAVPLSYSSYCEKSIKQKPDQPSQPQQSPASS